VLRGESRIAGRWREIALEISLQDGDCFRRLYTVESRTAGSDCAMDHELCSLAGSEGDVQNTPYVLPLSYRL
jgi:hypothetical protein